MRQRANPATVGAFVLGGVVLAVLVTLILGSGVFFADDYPLVSFFEGDVTGLDAGSPVRYRGVPIGQVTEVRISLEDDPRPATDTRIPVIYSLNLTRLRGLVRSGGMDFEEAGALDSLISMGLRAQMQGANLVTGQRAIELDLFPDAPDTRLDGGALPAPELPAVPNAMAQLQDRALEAVNDFASIDFKAIAERLDSALAGVDGLLASGQIDRALIQLEATLSSVAGTADEVGVLAEDLRASTTRVAEGVEGAAESSARTLAAVDSTLSTIRRTLNPDAPVLYRLDQTLRELEDAARAVRDLAAYLEQNPSALLKGRGGGEEDR
ncbi:MAG: MlaD family protein [Gemmatimonadota bacterium]